MQPSEMSVYIYVCIYCSSSLSFIFTIVSLVQCSSFMLLCAVTQSQPYSVCFELTCCAQTFQAKCPRYIALPAWIYVVSGVRCGTGVFFGHLQCSGHDSTPCPLVSSSLCPSMPRWRTCLLLNCGHCLPSAKCAIFLLHTTLHLCSLQNAIPTLTSPNWANSLTTSSACENLRSDSKEVEDDLQIDHIIWDVMSQPDVSLT